MAEATMDGDGGEPRGGVAMFGAAALTLVICGAIVWFAYSLGVREGLNAQPPRVYAEPGPIKTRPADPGGTQTPYQDQDVYDRLRGEEAPDPVGLAPPTEEPLDDALMAEPVATIDEAAGAASPAAEELITPPPAETADPLDAGEAATSAPMTYEEAIASGLATGGLGNGAAITASPEPTPAPSAPSAAAASEPPAPPVEEGSGDIIAELLARAEGVTPAPVASEPAPAPAPTAETAPTPNPTQTVATAPAAATLAPGGFAVQLASFRDAAAAERAWTQLATGGAASVLANTPHDIAAADLGSRGVYHRLRAGRFDARAGAIRLCERLKGVGVDCFVVAR